MINFSEMLWKSGRREESRFSGRSVVESEAVQCRPGLDRVIVDHVHLDPDSRVTLLTDSRSASADRFRYLRMRLRELRELAKMQSLVITSPAPEDGKSTIAISLATALAQAGKQAVLLIEADLHRPSLVRTLGLRSQSGLAECIEQGLDPLTQLRKVEPLGWYLLSAGETRGNPTELLQREAFRIVMQRLSSYFDWILVDTPPVLPLTDALSLSREVDATLLVVRADRTSRRAVEEAIERIGKNHLLGVLLNGAEGLRRLYSQYSGYYGKK